jgi:hypothetical protein
MNRPRTALSLLITVTVVGILFIGSYGTRGAPLGAVLRSGLSPGTTSLKNTTYCGVLGPNPGNTSDTAPEYFPNVTAAWNDLCVEPLFQTTLTNWGGLYNNTTAHAVRSHNVTIGETNASYVTNGTPWKWDPSAQANFVVSWDQSCANNTSLNCYRSATWLGNLSSNAVTGPFNSSNCVCGGGAGGIGSDGMIMFIEQGLPGGTVWYITINGSTFTAITDAFGIVFPFGTYDYVVGNVSGFSASPSTGYLTFEGASVAVTVYFNSTAAPGSPLPLFLGLQPTVAYLAIGTAISVVAILLGAFVRHRGRQRRRTRMNPRPPQAK